MRRTKKASYMGFQLCIYLQKAAPKSADKAFFGAVLCPEKAGVSVSFIINIQTKQEKGGRKLVKDNKNVWAPIGVKPSMLV